MSERPKPHNGRDVDGRHRVRETDVDELMTDINGLDYIEDDIRLGGAVADIGLEAGRLAQHLQHLIDNNRIDVNHLVARDSMNGHHGGAQHGHSGRQNGRTERGHRGRG